MVISSGFRKIPNSIFEIMGVLKWLRRDRTSLSNPNSPTMVNLNSPTKPNLGTIRTEKYKNDLAEFKARRASLNESDLSENRKKKSGRQSLPCMECTSDSKNNTFKTKYERSHKKTKQDSRRMSLPINNDVPNIQFLFKNQVFMPGSLFGDKSSSGRRFRTKKLNTDISDGDAKYLSKRQISFNDDNSYEVPFSPFFLKNSCLPFKVDEFIGSSVSPCSSDVNVVNPPLEFADQILCDEVGDCIKNDSCESKMREVMEELHCFDEWADDQLKNNYTMSSKGHESQVEESFHSLRLTLNDEIVVSHEGVRGWFGGKWTYLDVHVKKLADTTMKDVRIHKCKDVYLLRKFRHPNIVLLMALFVDTDQVLNLVCEGFHDNLHDLLHKKGIILSVQKSVKYISDVGSALLYLKMNNYVHTNLNSTCIMVTHSDVAKLAEINTCTKLQRSVKDSLIVTSPDYKNGFNSNNDGYVRKIYEYYENDPLYRWHAPELFVAENGFVKITTKSDVYSLFLMLWECCNAKKPWQKESYNQLHEQYTVYQHGIKLPLDGTYPGCLVDIMQRGLKLSPDDRCDINFVIERLQVIKIMLNNMDPIIVPEILISRNVNEMLTQVLSESQNTETIQTENKQNVSHENQKYLNGNDYSFELDSFKPHYLNEENGFSSNCSTPISKKRVKLSYIGTPGTQLHKTDSTEYCSVNTPANFNSKLSQCITPKSYKPLHITLPTLNLDNVQSLTKSNTSVKNGTYSFDIKSYSLPTTPIARSSKLLKNAWLSGEKLDEDIFEANEKSQNEKNYDNFNKDAAENQWSESLSPESDHRNSVHSHYETSNSSHSPKTQFSKKIITKKSTLPAPQYASSINTSDRQHSKYGHHLRQSDETIVDSSRQVDDVLTNVSVKPLVAIHERWIVEANNTHVTKSVVDGERRPTCPVKPASHYNTLQRTSQTGVFNASKNIFGMSSTSNISRQGSISDRFNQTRDFISRSINFSSQEFDEKLNAIGSQSTWKRDKTKIISQPIERLTEAKEKNQTDHSTSTTTIDDFIKNLIREEINHIIKENPNCNLDTSDILTQSSIKIVNKLMSCKSDNTYDGKRYSKVTINGNNKPLIQITFDKDENMVRILDKKVSVLISEVGEKKDCSDDRSTLKKGHTHNILQDARSTEDLYIDDELSSHLEETFADMKVIPLTGSLHEILCKKENDCCLIQVQKESGCDNVFLMCNTPKCGSHDTVDSSQGKSPILLKRSISFIEETYLHTDHAEKTNTLFERRHSESNLNIKPRCEKSRKAKSSPAVVQNFKQDLSPTIDIAQVMSCDSSDESLDNAENDNDEFIYLEHKIDEEMTSHLGFLSKISEENLVEPEISNKESKSSQVDEKSFVESSE